MRHATNTTNKTRRQVRFPGIITDAEALGVNRVTLYRVLNGTWKLPGLKSRYDALKASQKKLEPQPQS